MAADPMVKRKQGNGIERGWKLAGSHCGDPEEDGDMDTVGGGAGNGEKALDLTSVTVAVLAGFDDESDERSGVSVAEVASEVFIVFVGTADGAIDQAGEEERGTTLVGYYGLHCLPQKFICESPYPQYISMWPCWGQELCGGNKLKCSHTGLGDSANPI